MITHSYDDLNNGKSNTRKYSSYVEICRCVCIEYFFELAAVDETIVCDKVAYVSWFGFSTTTKAPHYCPVGPQVLLTWISFNPSLNICCIHYEVWDEITYPFPNFNGCSVEVWEWISNFIPHLIVITYPCWDKCSRCKVKTTCRYIILSITLDDVIKWKHFPRYWPFVWWIHRSPVNSPHKGQWCGALMLSLICVLNKRLSKRSWGWWYETPLRSLWRHCNDSGLLRNRCSMSAFIKAFWTSFYQHEIPVTIQNVFSPFKYGSRKSMITSWYRNWFPRYWSSVCGVYTGHWWIPLTKDQ